MCICATVQVFPSSRKMYIDLCFKIKLDYLGTSFGLVSKLYTSHDFVLGSYIKRTCFIIN